MFLSFYFPSHELFHYFCFISFYVIISLLFVSFLLHLLLCSMAFIWKYSSMAYTKKFLACFSFVYSNHLSQLLLAISLLFPIFQLEVAISPYGQMSCRRIVTFPSTGCHRFSSNDICRRRPSCLNMKNLWNKQIFIQSFSFNCACMVGSWVT